VKPSKEISIIIPNLNSPTIDRTIDSLKRQGHGLEDAEVIVVGVDESGLVKEDSTVHFVSTGAPVIPSAARNIGIAHSRGRYLFFIDADCIAAPDWLEKLSPYLYREECAVSGAVIFGEGNYWTLSDNLSMFHEYLPHSPRGPRRYLPTINLGVHRSVIADVGGFDETLPTAEDMDITARMYLQGYELYFEPQAIVYHLPQRTTPSGVWHHFMVSGRNSIRVRERYQDVFETPFPLMSPWLLLILSPLVSIFMVVKILLYEGNSKQYWHTTPVLFLTKLAWCLSAVQGLWEQSGGRREREHRV